MSETDIWHLGAYSLLVGLHKNELDSRQNDVTPQLQK